MVVLTVEPLRSLVESRQVGHAGERKPLVCVAVAGFPPQLLDSFVEDKGGAGVMFIFTKFSLGKLRLQVLHFT